MNLFTMYRVLSAAYGSASRLRMRAILPRLIGRSQRTGAWLTIGGRKVKEGDGEGVIVLWGYARGRKIKAPPRIEITYSAGTTRLACTIRLALSQSETLLSGARADRTRGPTRQRAEAESDKIAKGLKGLLFRAH